MITAEIGSKSEQNQRQLTTKFFHLTLNFSFQPHFPLKYPKISFRFKNHLTVLLLSDASDLSNYLARR